MTTPSKQIMHEINTPPAPTKALDFPYMSDAAISRRLDFDQDIEPTLVHVDDASSISSMSASTASIPPMGLIRAPIIPRKNGPQSPCSTCYSVDMVNYFYGY